MFFYLYILVRITSWFIAQGVTRSRRKARRSPLWLEPDPCLRHDSTATRPPPATYRHTTCINLHYTISPPPLPVPFPSSPLTPLGTSSHSLTHSLPPGPAIARHQIRLHSPPPCRPAHHPQQRPLREQSCSTRTLSRCQHTRKGRCGISTTRECGDYVERRLNVLITFSLSLSPHPPTHPSIHPDTELSHCRIRRMRPQPHRICDVGVPHRAPRHEHVHGPERDAGAAGCRAPGVVPAEDGEATERAGGGGAEG